MPSNKMPQSNKSTKHDFFGSPLSLCSVRPSSTEGESRSCDSEGAGGNGAGEQEPLAGARDRRGLDQRRRGEVDLDVTEGWRPLVEVVVPVRGVVHGAGVCLVAMVRAVHAGLHVVIAVVLIVVVVAVVPAVALVAGPVVEGVVVLLVGLWLHRGRGGGGLVVSISIGALRCAFSGQRHGENQHCVRVHLVGR